MLNFAHVQVLEQRLNTDMLDIMPKFLGNMQACRCADNASSQSLCRMNACVFACVC